MNFKRYFFVFILAIILYGVTCAPTVLWQDSGMYQYRTWQHDIRGGLGLALAHNLYFFIAIIFSKIPFGDFAYKVNFLSAICGAFTVANVFFLVYLITEKGSSAVIGALTMVFSHTLWQHSNIAEVYSMYTAFFSAELIILFLFIKFRQSKYLYWLGFVNGLSISVHMFGVIPLFCYLCLAGYYVVKKEIKFKIILFAFLLWLVGFLPYAYLIIEHFIKTQDLTLTINSALFGSGYSGNVLSSSFTVRMFFENILFIGLNFATPNILLLFVGISVFCKTEYKHVS